MKLKPLVILTLLISFIYFGLTIGWSHLSYKTLTTYCDETELEKSHVSEIIMMQSNTLHIGDYSAAKPFTGFNLCKYEDGQKKSEGKYLDGKRHGSWTFFDENGRIESMVMYIEGEDMFD